MDAFASERESSLIFPRARERMTSDTRSATLYWSRLGEVACSLHAPLADRKRWDLDKWRLVDHQVERWVLQCPHCHGGVSLQRRPKAEAS